MITSLRASHHCVLQNFKELLSSQEKSYAETQAGCAKTMKCIIYVELKIQDFEAALKSLCALEDILLEQEGADPKELQMTQKLMGQVNYQVLKYPTAGCNIFLCSSEVDEAIDINQWIPQKPINGSKMSGHRVTCA